MSGAFFPDNTIHLLEKTLAWRNRSQEIIAGNLANLETPNYTRKELNFQEVLNGYLRGGTEIALLTTDVHHLPGSRLGLGSARETGAPVDLDQEMVELSMNQLGYQTSVTMLKKKLDQLRTAIEGGKV